MLFNIPVYAKNYNLDFDTAKKMTHVMASSINPDTDLVAWNDRKHRLHSPSLPRDVECNSRGLDHWEKYGKSHNGRLKFIVNDGEFEFIFS